MIPDPAEIRPILNRWLKDGIEAKQFEASLGDICGGQAGMLVMLLFIARGVAMEMAIDPLYGEKMVDVHERLTKITRKIKGEHGIEAPGYHFGLIVGSIIEYAARALKKVANEL